ncbi:hypothetical protein T310_7656 [Rasamsonia emersonii CBS 393.64]|uniref:C2H2-type domain-containing protein n=1 Tax=Rasamsonia emersonii (strain ATCC 16479 / CBS 393.64 / IMI 116815) TaxID=1408163 RepID=A0A0F4YLB7_RASE3|nr:hypothetical protein T310_7656 [Rasamsonia emersonii CBS 393.64]KKA18393.1 hypothetical protein T310_7656 [Rasamsonia emersonii CBS 393.64]
MENRIISSPHALDHFRQSCKPVPEAASRYSCPDPLLGLQLPQIGPDPALDAFRNGNNSATLEFADTSFPSVSLARFHREQDAWNSLQVTGLPRNLKPSPGRQLHHVPKTSTGMDDSHARFSRHDPSETDSQVTHSDSGYGSRRGDSEISSLYPVEPISSPGTIVSSYNCNRFDTGSSGDNRPVYNASSFGTAAINFQSRYPQEIRCSYPDCSWTGKCPSDKKKHEARHTKQWICDEPNCTRKEGFGTINDLERHKKCVHGKIPGRGPKKMYMCFGRNCRRSSKKWPRYDNFRQHLRRAHPTESEEELLKRSDEWYYSWKQTIETANSLVDLSILSPPRQATPLPQICDRPRGPEEAGSRSTCDSQPADEHIAPSQTVTSYDDIYSPPSEELTLSPIKNIDIFEDQSRSGCGDVADAGAAPEEGSVSPPRIRQQPVELPGLKSLNLPHTLDQEPSTVTAQQRQAQPISSSDGPVAKVAMDMLNALARNLNKTSKRQAEQGKEDNHFSKTPVQTATGTTAGAAPQTSTSTDSLSDSQKKFLSTVLSAALEQLGGQTPGQADNTATNQAASDESDSKQEGYQCDVCHKWKRLKCELKKHKTRHERPFGCTFNMCYKTFGSKADWKRHENSQHFHLQSWRCSLPSKKYAGVECASLYYRQELFIRHLTDHHGVKEGDAMMDFLTKNRIGRNGQNQFWCGFCRKILPLTSKGLDAWNERFDHIDMEHFKRGQRIDDWLPAEGHLTKKEIREEERKKREAEKHTATSEATPTAESVEGSDGESEGGDSPEVSLASHQDGAAQRGPVSAVEAGNDSANPRKRKFSSDPLSPEDWHGISNKSAGAETDQQQQSGEREMVKRRKLEPPSLNEHPSDDDDHDRDHSHSHQSRTTSHSTDGRQTAAMANNRMRSLEKNFQPRVYCCNCNRGPWNLVLMTSCLECEHAFCQYCIFEPLVGF